MVEYLHGLGEFFDHRKEVVRWPTKYIRERTEVLGQNWPLCAETASFHPKEAVVTSRIGLFFRPPMSHFGRKTDFSDTT